MALQTLSLKPYFFFFFFDRHTEEGIKDFFIFYFFTLFGISQNCHRELSDNFISHPLHKSRKHCESQLHKLRKFPALSKLRRIPLTKFHREMSESVISLTGGHYVIEGTFHCVKEWSPKQQREGSCLKRPIFQPTLSLSHS